MNNKHCSHKNNSNMRQNLKEKIWMFLKFRDQKSLIKKIKINTWYKKCKN